jgi:biotin carboxyl carrier protein
MSVIPAIGNGWVAGNECNADRGEMRYITNIEGCDYLVEILDEHHVSVDGKIYTVDFQSISEQPVYSLLLDNESYEAYVYPLEHEMQVLILGRLFSVFVEDERERRLRLQASAVIAESQEFQLKSPMPGLIISVPVVEGEKVSRGEVLVILESMKMQNELKSPRDGVVSRIRVKPGDRVEISQHLLNIV